MTAETRDDLWAKLRATTTKRELDHFVQSDLAPHRAADDPDYRDLVATAAQRRVFLIP
jgi:hypothetical protein